MILATLLLLAAAVNAKHSHHQRSTVRGSVKLSSLRANRHRDGPSHITWFNSAWGKKCGKKVSRDFTVYHNTGVGKLGIGKGFSLAVYLDSTSGMPNLCRYAYGSFGPISVAGLTSTFTAIDGRKVSERYYKAEKRSDSEDDFKITIPVLFKPKNAEKYLKPERDVLSQNLRLRGSQQDMEELLQAVLEAKNGNQLALSQQGNFYVQYQPTTAEYAAWAVFPFLRRHDA